MGATEGGKEVKKWELNRSWEGKGTPGKETQPGSSAGGQEGWEGKGAELQGSAETKGKKKLLCSSFSREQRGTAQAPHAARVHFEQQKDPGSGSEMKPRQAWREGSWGEGLQAGRGGRALPAGRARSCPARCGVALRLVLVRPPLRRAVFGLFNLF